VGPELEREELNDLLGAYALDAVEGSERERVERLVETDPRARAEVVTFRETAAMLAHGGTDAPAGLWDRIVGAMEEEPPRLELPHLVVTPLPARPVEATKPRRAVTWQWVGVAAAIAATLIAVLVVQVARQDQRLNRLDASLRRDATARAAQQSKGVPGSRTVALTTDGGAELANVVLRVDGAGYFIAEGMPRAPKGDTYQLWALVGDAKAPTAISAGVLGRDPRVASFRFSGSVLGFAVTQERDPGVVSSKQPLVVHGTFSEA
jgi:hypothetical protein